MGGSNARLRKCRVTHEQWGAMTSYLAREGPRVKPVLWKAGFGGHEGSRVKPGGSAIAPMIVDSHEALAASPLCAELSTLLLPTTALRTRFTGKEAEAHRSLRAWFSYWAPQSLRGTE